jgi:hypothetical protein
MWTRPHPVAGAERSDAERPDRLRGKDLDVELRGLGNIALREGKKWICESAQKKESAAHAGGH